MYAYSVARPGMSWGPRDTINQAVLNQTSKTKTACSQQGLGHRCPGLPLDICHGSNTYTVVIGGTVKVCVGDSCAMVYHGGAVRISSDLNIAHDHTVAILGGHPAAVYVLTFCRVRLVGARHGEWTTPARRLESGY